MTAVVRSVPYNGCEKSTSLEGRLKDDYFAPRPHSAVHAWYHGTIDHEARSDGDIPIDPDWYSSSLLRTTEGFNYSKLGGGSPPESTAPDLRDYTTDTTYDLAHPFFNGDFSYNGKAGWEEHGGTNANIGTLRWVLELSSGRSVPTHN